MVSTDYNWAYLSQSGSIHQTNLPHMHTHIHTPSIMLNLLYIATHKHYRALQQPDMQIMSGQWWPLSLWLTGKPLRLSMKTLIESKCLSPQNNMRTKKGGCSVTLMAAIPVGHTEWKFVQHTYQNKKLDFACICVR